MVTVPELFEVLYSPAPWLVYKPRAENGSAMRVRYRVTPQAEDVEGKIFLRRPMKGSGLYIDLAAQFGADQNGNPTFNWPEKALEGAPNALTMKLGLVDIQKLLVGYRLLRVSGKPTPTNLRALERIEGKWQPEQKGNTVGLFHKNTESNSAFVWTFAAEQSYVKISKPGLNRSIALDLGEELAFENYLRLTMHMFQLVGLR